MKTIVRSSPIREPDALTKKVMSPGSIMFDIETTGFHKDKTSLYLIGVGRITGRDFEITQFFAEDKSEEEAVLSAFLSYLGENSVKSLVSFNGLGFDVPYLSHKLKDHFMSGDLLSYDHTDIYRIVSAQKALFKLPNYKQKSVEAFLNIHRDDEYNGGQLIPVYEAYTKTQDDDLLSLLLLHNYEDVLGMLDLIPALSYFYDLNGSSFMSPSGCRLTDDELTLEFKLEYPVPKSLYLEGQSLSLTFAKDRGTLVIAAASGELKLFYPDHRDYYYLPDEDTAYHKSVAEFMDKSRRVKATKETAYTRVSGRFIPSFGLTCQQLFYKDSPKGDGFIKADEPLLEAPWLPDYLRQIREYIKIIK